ncbi:unnamed protein product [Echinostoma caproni]|uniref:Uncharacterized protein n=1 Tax=Echinostoma caproni TaxID=27848 RepID=A0A3P8L6V2_9TREM|nr:unnamed protein product [Echinostoma caproni]
MKEARDKRYKTRLAEWEELCDTTRTQRLAELKAKREAEAAAEAERKAREEEAARREAELAAEAERIKQAQKAKEAEERAAAREEEERQRAANRKTEPEQSPFPPRPADSTPRYSRPPGSMLSRNEPLRSQGIADTTDWIRGSAVKAPTAFEVSPKRPTAPVEPAARPEHPAPAFGRGPRRTMPAEFESALHDDDAGGGWTQVGQPKDSDRAHNRPYVPPSLGRGARHSAMPGGMRSGPPRRERGTFGFSGDANDWSRGSTVGSNRGGSSGTTQGSNWRAPPKN